jgi:hypothetical protein
MSIDECLTVFNTLTLMMYTMPTALGSKLSFLVLKLVIEKRGVIWVHTEAGGRSLRERR